MIERSTCRCASLIVAALAATPLAAQSAQPRFETIEGDTWQAELLEIRDDAVSFRRAPEGEVERRALDEFYRLALAEVEPRYAPHTTLWLRSGVKLPARFAGVDEGGDPRFELAPGLPPLAFAWRHVQAVLFAPVDGALDAGFVERIANPGEDRDTLYAFNAEGGLQRVSLEVLGYADDKLAVKFGGAERTLPRERLYGFVLGDQAGTAPDRQPNPRVTLVLRDAIELSGKLLALDAEVARLRLDEGVELSLPRGRVGEVRVRSDNLRYLTELDPGVEQTPAFDRVWPWLRNEGPGGDAIRLGGRAYRNGVVMFPKTKLTFGLDGDYDTFEAIIGMEDRAGDRAHAVFRVWGDDEVLFESAPMTGDSEPQALRVPVAGHSRIALEVDFGKSFDLGDYCVFALPRVIKT